jgi:hypothetical protein
MHFCQDDLCYPTVFLLGAQKAATTSLFVSMVSQGVCCDAEMDAHVVDTAYADCLACSPKETHFFTGLRDAKGGEIAIDGRRWKNDEADVALPFVRQDYTQLFPLAKRARIGCDAGFIEATPMLQHRTAALRMYNFLPLKMHAQVRIVVVLREPISRDLSWYNHKVDGFISGDSKVVVKEAPPKYPAYVKEEAAKYNDCVAEASGDRFIGANTCFTPAGEPKSALIEGMYATHLGRLLMHWERRQVIVLQMEALLDDTHGQLALLYQFIGTAKLPPLSIPKENTHDSPLKVKSIPCAVKQKLQGLFEPHNKALFALLKRQREARSAAEPNFPPFPDLVACF